MYPKIIRKAHNLRLKHFLTFLCLSASVCISNAQWIEQSRVLALNSSFYDVYNLDGHLISGRKYFNRYPNAPGHPFFSSDEFKQGKVIVNGILYNDVLLKFDIVNQELVLQFSNVHGGNDQIILSSENISEFELDGRVFRKYEFPGKGKTYLQVLADNKITCLYSWKKSLISQRYSLDNPYKYSEQVSKAYLLINNHFIGFRGNSSFLKIFPGELHQEIKRFLKTNKINLKSASDNTVRQLVNYCTQISDLSKFDLSQ
ncbi:MAG: hypothetical protein JSV22_07245 [Bacteroidales bacterium]|nr:MAG: hypothetical protein JSV22_07245 [Bacteroidales bacterium]